MNRSNYYNKSAEYWWRLCVIATDNGRCVICGTGGTVETHHIFKKSQTDWRYLFKIEFGCCLHPDCHISDDNPNAPHGLAGSNKRFLKLLEEKLSLKRWAPIQKQLDTPYTMPPAITPPMKMIRDDLKKRFKEKTKDSWMDADVEPEHRGRRA